MNKISHEEKAERNNSPDQSRYVEHGELDRGRGDGRRRRCRLDVLYPESTPTGGRRRRVCIRIRCSVRHVTAAAVRIRLWISDLEHSTPRIATKVISSPTPTLSTVTEAFNSFPYALKRIGRVVTQSSTFDVVVTSE
ncbi:hypothetical protein FRC18_004024 [Serendipita sp. 400]|nr:hypothetical protein FRC18_004024 [Serendipita sp. 400]